MRFEKINKKNENNLKKFINNYLQEITKKKILIVRLIILFI